MKPTPILCLVAAATFVGCAADPAPGPDDAGRLAVTVAALDLAGVGDVVWDLEVANAADDVVWQRRLTSSGFGDSAGSASFVGTCDATAGVADNVVSVWVVGVYTGDVADAGAFNAGSTAGDGAVSGTGLPFQNPTADAALTRTVTCRANEDAAVQFDVALMRPAEQGFFDVAVSFSDIFCSAKLDCCVENPTGTACERDIALLFDATGTRARTYVLGFACTASPRAGVETELYLDALALDCSAPTSGADFAAQLILDPATGGPGNVCTPGELSNCAAVSELGVDADTFLFQLATFRGAEALTSGGVAAHKIYWNVALGVTPSIGGCRLRTRGTAHDLASTADQVDDGAIAAGAVYPYVVWDVDLGDCRAEGLTFGAGGPVTTAYSGTGDDATRFAFFFGPGAPAGSFCDPLCQNGGVCLASVCDCAGTEFQGPTCEDPLPVAATGGAESTYADAGTTYRVHTFTAGGTLTVTRGGDVDYLVVAGGGGGGGGYNHCGGGGAGGLQEGSLTVGVSAFAVTVGGGGGGAASGVGGTGGSSAFAGVTAAGGGGGCASAYGTGVAGGSGGGGCALSGQGGAGVAGQGYKGGTGSSANLGAQDSGAGGGGGAGGLGSPQGATGPFTNSPGPGGPAHTSTITGTAAKYAAGGNGAGYYSSLPTDGIGGASPGQGIGASPSRVSATAGAANTGSGGGGGRAAQQSVATSATGGAGGSGVVIIRYPID